MLQLSELSIAFDFLFPLLEPCRCLYILDREQVLRAFNRFRVIFRHELSQVVAKIPRVFSIDLWSACSKI